jgi:Txe/YoeB family toxin of Txe-Axe toxin-antitoxin module
VGNNIENWSCEDCNINIFPFNNIENEIEFRCIVSNNNVDSEFLEANNYLLNYFPSDLNDINNDILTEEYDPEINYYNALTCEFLENCKYYNSDSFNIKIGNCQSTFSIISMNIRSASKNLDEFLSFLHILNHSFSFIGLVETWFTKENVETFSIGGYSHEFLCRENKRGGGISLFISNKILNYKIRTDLSKINENYECLFVEVDKSVFKTPKNVIVGLLYRMPNTDINIFNDDIEKIYSETINKENKIIYFMGDTNINLLNEQSHELTAEFSNINYSHSVMPLINKPTRICSTSSTLIDNIFTNNINSNMYVGLFLTGITDHLPIFMINNEFQLDNKEEIKFIYKRVFNERNYTTYTQLLETTDFSMIYNEENAQTAFTVFHNKLLTIFNTAFPVSKINIRYKNRKPWLTEGLKKSIKIKNNLYVKQLKYGSIEFKEKYKKFRNKLNHLLRIAEKKHISDLLEKYKFNMKKTWGVMKDVINKNNKPTNCTVFKQNDKLINDKDDICNSFNNFFINIGNTLEKKIPQSNRSPLDFMYGSFTNNLFLNPVNESEILLIINKMKSNSSPGWDEITSDSIKKTHIYLLQPLVYLLNLSLSQGIFPQELKIASVVPIFKNSDRSKFSNYRPVSVLPAFSKIFERVFYNRLLEFLTKYDVLNSNQFGFKKNHPTHMALILLVDKIVDALEKGEYVIGVFLDFSKAFDTVNHDILLKKLHYYGVRGIAYDWIKSYLSQRTQYVKYENHKSSHDTICCGVPQGSILGPLLFLIYINDLVYVSRELYFVLFADDTNVFLSGKNINDVVNRINNELLSIVEWLKANRLSLNIDKTKYMIFKPKRQILSSNVEVKLSGFAIEEVTNIKFLGVVLDNKLNFKEHLSYICKKVSKCIGILYKARQFINHTGLIILYNSCFYPYVSYCIHVWGGTFKTYMKPLEILQRKAVRCICFLRKFDVKNDNNDSVSKYINDLSILKLENIYYMELILFMYKYTVKSLPKIFLNHFTYNNDIHNYNTRSANQLRVIRYESALGQNSFHYNATKIWNEVGDKIYKENENKSYKCFKKNVKLHLLQKQ